MYYIQSISNNNNNISMRSRNPLGNRNNSSSSFFKKLKQKLLNIVPEKTFKDSEGRNKNLNKATDVISRPHWNRTIMGVTAVSQPIIDHCNPWVDEDTKEVSTNKTIAKVCVGSIVGIIVRKIIYELVNGMTKTEGKKQWQKLLLPAKFDTKLLTNHKNLISSLISIIVVLFTNFKIDAPLTAYYTNKLNEKRAAKKAKEAMKNNQTSPKRGVIAYV